MKEAREFLCILTERLPPPPESHHMMAVFDGQLRVVVRHHGHRWSEFGLDEEDFERPPEDLVNDIVALMERQSQA